LFEGTSSEKRVTRSGVQGISERSDVMSARRNSEQHGDQRSPLRAGTPAPPKEAADLQKTLDPRYACEQKETGPLRGAAFQAAAPAFLRA